MNKFLVSCTIALTILVSACQKESLQDGSLQSQSEVTDKSQLTKKNAELLFAQILSKATYAEPQLRGFLKKVALEQNDNDYNIFYPLAKNRTVTDGKTFAEILQKYTKNDKELAQIEKSAPLLNVFVPDLSLFDDSLSVNHLNTQDCNTPVYYNGKFYVDGSVTDSVSEETRGMLPLFHTFVVGESHRMKLKDGITRATSEASYTFVDDGYNPAKTHTYNPLTRNRSYYYGDMYEKYEERFDATKNTLDTTYLPKETLEAFKQVGSGNGVLRTKMVYQLNQLNDFNTQKRELDLSVKDIVFRMKLNPAHYYWLSRHREQKAAPGVYLSPYVKDGEYYDRGGDPDYNEVFNRLWTEGHFTFHITVVTGTSKTVTPISLSPKDLFTATIHVRRKHKTAFRASHSWYRIDVKELRSKWIYPHYINTDLRFESWNPFDQTLQRSIYVSVLGTNAKNVNEKRKDDTYMTRLKTGVEGSVTIPISKDGNGNPSIKLSSDWEKQHTVQLTERVQIDVADNEILTGNRSYHFFSPSPIERIEGNKAYLTTELFGCFDMCIMPVKGSLIKK